MDDLAPSRGIPRIRRLQIRELVTKWLDGNDSRIRVFFDQLEKSSSLKEMMTIPLLASLIVLVFKQTGSPRKQDAPV